MGDRHKKYGGLRDKKPCSDPSTINHTIFLKTRISTKSTEESYRVDRIRSKGVLDKSYGTESQR